MPFGSLIIDLTGIELQPEEQELIEHPFVGGIILFSRNFQSSEQLQWLTQSIRRVKDKPLLIMVDQEGGRVQRFRQEFTRLPPAAFYSHFYENNPILALQLAEHAGWIMATELLTQEIDLSLAPILDLNKGVSSIIGDRAFHQDPVIAVKLAAAFIQGMKNAGMSATGKHFPGHGSVAPDSHLELPVDPRSFEVIEKEDLRPFIHFINTKIPALMTAHILFPCVDHVPVSFSRRWLRDILRDRLRFEGIIMSDDLSMKGAQVAENFIESVRLAGDAGCDLILLCNNRPAVIQVLDGLPYTSYMLNIEKYELLRGRFAHPRPNKIWQEKRDFLLKYSETT